MTDHSELKKLAEYATPGPWVALHPNAGQRGSEVASGGGLNQVCADLGPSNALYIAAANPAAVLALLADVEALRSQVAALQSDPNSWQSGYDEGRSIGTKTALDERGQLRAENKRLSELLECSQGDMRTADKIIAERDRLLSMFDCPDHGQCVPYAMEQVEALRKDAERYRFLKSRTQQADIELAVCLHDKRTQVTVFLDGEYVDSQTDIAMSQGVKP